MQEIKTHKFKKQFICKQTLFINHYQNHSLFTYIENNTLLSFFQAVKWLSKAEKKFKSTSHPVKKKF